MKIIDIRAARVGKSPIVRVVTDEGLDGLAEIESSKPYVTQTLPLYRDALLGEDPTQVERCMMRIRRMGGFKPWGAVGLEWATSSPPPKDNFHDTPVVTWEAYDYPAFLKAMEPTQHV